jgi:hypothetical protein
VLFDNRRMLHSTLPWVDVPHLLHQVFLRTRTQMLPCDDDALAVVGKL